MCNTRETIQFLVGRRTETYSYEPGNPASVLFVDYDGSFYTINDPLDLADVQQRIFDPRCTFCGEQGDVAEGDEVCGRCNAQIEREDERREAGFAW